MTTPLSKHWNCVNVVANLRTSAIQKGDGMGTREREAKKLGRDIIWTECEFCKYNIIFENHPIFPHNTAFITDFTL